MTQYKFVEDGARKTIIRFPDNGRRLVLAEGDLVEVLDDAEEEFLTAHLNFRRMRKQTKGVKKNEGKNTKSSKSSEGKPRKDS